MDEDGMLKEMLDEDGMLKEMPKYKSHKAVWAHKIKQINQNTDVPGALITPMDESYIPFGVNQAYLDKHNPKVGGYYVVYEDGYQSWSPAAAFEKGYSSRVSGVVAGSGLREDVHAQTIMDGIGWAVNQVRNGKCVARRGWNGKNQYIALQNHDLHSKMTEPYVYMKNAQGGLIPWLCSQGDLLALDWEIV